MSKIRIVIACRHPIFRTALGTMLKGIRDFEVVAVVDLSQLADVASKLKVDVYLVGLSDCGPEGLRVVARLVRAAPASAVVIMSPNPSAGYVRTMLAIGITAYVLRSSENSELYKAIRAAHRRKLYLDPRLGSLLAELPFGRNSRAKGRAHPNSLSARESEVLRQVAQGFTTRAISLRLGVSERTVQTYRERITEKLQLRTRADLVRYAIAYGMLDTVNDVSQQGK